MSRGPWYLYPTILPCSPPCRCQSHKLSLPAVLIFSLALLQCCSSFHIPVLTLPSSPSSPDTPRNHLPLPISLSFIAFNFLNATNMFSAYSPLTQLPSSFCPCAVLICLFFSALSRAQPPGARCWELFSAMNRLFNVLQKHGVSDFKVVRSGSGGTLRRGHLGVSLQRLWNSGPFLPPWLLMRGILFLRILPPRWATLPKVQNNGPTNCGLELLRPRAKYTVYLCKVIISDNVCYSDGTHA